MVGQVVRELIDKGKAQGLAEGLTLGKARALEHRFSRLPNAIPRRIATAAPTWRVVIQCWRFERIQWVSVGETTVFRFCFLWAS